MVGKRKSGRFTLKNERELIAMAAKGATASEIAAKFKTSLKTIERKARALGISIKGGRGRPGGNEARAFMFAHKPLLRKTFGWI